MLHFCLGPGGAKEVFALDLCRPLGVLLNSCPIGPLYPSRVAGAGVLSTGGAKGHGDTGQHRSLRHDGTGGHSDTERHSGAGDMMMSIKDMVPLGYTETLWDTVMLEDMLTGGFDISD